MNKCDKYICFFFNNISQQKLKELCGFEVQSTKYDKESY